MNKWTALLKIIFLKLSRFSKLGKKYENYFTKLIKIKVLKKIKLNLIWWECGKGGAKSGEGKKKSRNDIKNKNKKVCGGPKIGPKN